MKNLKLLLATTAILSMGAMAANAVSSDTVNVSVKLFPMTTVEVIQQPNIGIFTFSPNNYNGEIPFYTERWRLLSLNESGQISSSDTSGALVVKQPTNGQLNVSCSVLEQSVFGTSINIEDEDSHTLFTVKYKCEDDENNKAKIILSELGSNWSGFDTFLQNGGGEATGTFTVTTVY